MIRTVIAALLLVIGWGGAGFSQTGDCLASNSPVRGELKLLRTRHPAGYPIEALMFVFKPPVCVMVPEDATSGKVERLEVGAMHIVPKREQASRLKRMLRKTVTVRGNITASETAWHQGDAIMFEAAIVEGAR